MNYLAARDLVAAAGALGVLSPEKSVYNGRSTAHARFDFDCSNRAVSFARPAFHTGIPVCNVCLVLVHLEDSMRADYGAHTAPDTFFCIELQRNNIFQIFCHACLK
jgi:hypothetical protein